MMGAPNPTRAGSVAQRSGAPALRLHYYREGDAIYRSRPFDLFFTLSLAPGPVGADKSVAQPASRCLRAGGRGSRVLERRTHRTSNTLVFNGSAVLFQTATRDVRVCVRMRACREDTENYRTSEPNQENGRNTPFAGRRAVLDRFCGSGANIIWGGYALPGRIVAETPDPQCYGGAAPQNFWAWCAVDLARLACDRGGLARLGRAGGNGGFLRVCGGRIGHVGMPVSECGAQHAVKSELSGDGHKLSRLSLHGELGGAGRTIGMGGQIAQAEGVGPPTRARPNSRMLAHAAFRILIDLLFYRKIATGLDWAGRSRLSVKMGSGDSLALVSRWLEGRTTLNLGDETRVGDGGGPGARSPLGEAWKLWGGRGHVNA